MGTHRRRRRNASLLTTSLSIIGILSAVTGVIIVVAPFGIGAERPHPKKSALPRTATDARTEMTAMVPSSPLVGTAFDGSAPVGALFDVSGGSLTGHHCSASVVDSSTGDLVITAAHCTGTTAQLAFVPDYHDGQMPYGVWTVSQVVTDASWQSSHDPDDDVAFLVVHRSGSAKTVQSLTGAEELGIDQPADEVVRVIGYPAATNMPVSCQNRTSSFDSTQLRFACANYPDGTSGGPFLVDVDPVTGKGTVIGVVGGYQQGGYTPSVSYSPAFGQQVETLFQTAVSEG